MPWRFSADVRPYAIQVWDLLAADPARYTVALTVLDAVRDGRRRSDVDMLFGWYSDDRDSDAPVTGAVCMTPPYELLLAEVPDAATAELVDALRADGVALPGVVGEAGTVDRFVALWTAGTGGTPGGVSSGPPGGVSSWRSGGTPGGPPGGTSSGPPGGTSSGPPRMRQRLYRLGTVHSPPAPPGEAGLAGPEDVVLVANWFAAFQREAGATPVDVEPIAREGVADRLIWLWRNPSGAVVSLAGRTRVVATVARVGPVYTPPVWRRRGYGAAVTAACTQDALHAGAAGVVLFTDLANPTSNEIYQRLGYLPLHDHQVVRFRDGA